jgi:hypothetical protein
MDTRDWAEEAHAWFESYHQAMTAAAAAEASQQAAAQEAQQQHDNDNVNAEIMDAATKDVVASRFFGNLIVDDALWQRFISHPVLMGGAAANKHNKNSNNKKSDNGDDTEIVVVDTVDQYAKQLLLNWKSHDFDLLEQDRGWQPLLRSLPKVQHYRLLTLIRRNLLQPFDNDENDDVSNSKNETLVSRHLWVLLEGLRWKAGLYQRPDVLAVIQQHYTNASSSRDESCSTTTTTSTACHSSSLEVVCCSNSSNGGGGGRFVVWKGESPALPGHLLCQAKPLCISLYNIHVPDGTLSACFHCGRQQPPSSSCNMSSSTMNNTPAKRNLVRDLTFLCPKCRVWSYCCLTCQQESEWLHQHECAHLPKLLDHCRRQRRGSEEEEESTSSSSAAAASPGMPAYKALLVLRAALQKQHPKPETQQQWKQLMELETHLPDHEQQMSVNNNSYMQQAQEFSQWMLDNGLLGSGSASDVTVQELVHIFLAINVNAIGLGDAAAGLFPGMPSMFNHSCNENVTHSWHGSLGMVQFRAVEIISPFDGSGGGGRRRQQGECCISYVSELEKSTPERTASLAKYKFFTCRCPRCRSKDEQGRLNATMEWKECMHALQQETNDSIQFYRRLVELSSILFPTYFVTKGWAMEECAHALQQDARCRDESIQLLEMAREQYGTCRGFDSPLMERVDQALHSLLTTSASATAGAATIAPQQGESNENDDDDESAELCLNNGGWSNAVLLEIKTYEAPPHADDWGVLAQRIKDYWSDVNVVQWSGGVSEDTNAPAASSADEHENNNNQNSSPHGNDDTNSYRLLDLAYGIQSLVLSCRIDQSIKTREQVAQETEEVFDDIIQHVDLIVASDYVY